MFLSVLRVLRNRRVLRVLNPSNAQNPQHAKNFQKPQQPNPTIWILLACTRTNDSYGTFMYSMYYATLISNICCFELEHFELLLFFKQIPFELLSFQRAAVSQPRIHYSVERIVEILL